MKTLLQKIKFCTLLLLFTFSVTGQTTVNIPCNISPNSNSGNVTNGGSKNFGEIRTSSAYRGWARFDLSAYIPAGATITEATIRYNVFHDPDNSNRHYLRIFTGDPSSMSGSAIYNAIDSWSVTPRHETTPNETNGTGWKTRGINATGIGILQSNLSDLINVGFGLGEPIGGTPNYYRFRGADHADSPILIITYTLPCSVPDQPSIINGTTTVCSGDEETYSVTNDPSATSYTWTLPSGYTGASTTNSIDATAGSTGGTITVTAVNACGSSAQQTINTTVNTIPDQPSTINGTTTVCAGNEETYSVTIDPSATSYTWTLPSGYTGTSTTNSIDATAGSTGGTITVTADNACGSSAQQTINTTVNTIPDQPSTINGTTTVCSGDEETYNVTNDPSATSYTWTLPSGYTGTSTTNSIDATAGSTGGTIIVTADNACGSSAQQTITTIVTEIDNSVSLSGIVLTSNQAGATYKWLDCNNGNAEIIGETSQSYTPATNGSYAVEVTLNGCKEMSACSTISTVGIDENGFSHRVKLYPNPTSANITIEWAVKLEKIEIRDALGRLVYKINDGLNNQQAIDISHVKNGVYFIHLFHEEGVHVAEVVKQ